MVTGAPGGAAAVGLWTAELDGVAVTLTVGSAGDGEATLEVEDPEHAVSATSKAAQSAARSYRSDSRPHRRPHRALIQLVTEIRVSPRGIDGAMRFLTAILVAAFLLVACGSTSSSAGGQPQGSIKVTTTEFKFDPGSITVAHGKVVFYVVNAGTAAHDMIIQNGGAKVAGSELISPGDTSVFTIDDLQPGTYTYFCDRPGHEASGMEGTLTVT